MVKREHSEPAALAMRDAYAPAVRGKEVEARRQPWRKPILPTPYAPPRVGGEAGGCRHVDEAGRAPPRIQVLQESRFVSSTHAAHQQHVALRQQPFFDLQDIQVAAHEAVAWFASSVGFQCRLSCEERFSFLRRLELAHTQMHRL